MSARSAFTTAAALAVLCLGCGGAEERGAASVGTVGGAIPAAAGGRAVWFAPCEVLTESTLRAAGVDATVRDEGVDSFCDFDLNSYPGVVLQLSTGGANGCPDGEVFKPNSTASPVEGVTDAFVVTEPDPMSEVRFAYGVYCDGSSGQGIIALLLPDGEGTASAGGIYVTFDRLAESEQRSILEGAVRALSGAK